MILSNMCITLGVIYIIYGFSFLKYKRNIILRFEVFIFNYINIAVYFYIITILHRFDNVVLVLYMILIVLSLVTYYFLRGTYTIQNINIEQVSKIINKFLNDNKVQYDFEKDVYKLREIEKQIYIREGIRCVIIDVKEISNDKLSKDLITILRTNIGCKNKVGYSIIAFSILIMLFGFYRLI